MILAACTALSCGGDAPDPGSSAAAEPGPAAGPTEEPREAGDGSPRVLALGTSLTAGLGLADPLVESWPGRLQALADSAGLEVDVVNAGVSGDTSAGGLRRLAWLLQEPVDVLIVELGANDGLRGLKVEALQENLEEVIRQAREANPEVEIVLAGMQAPPNMGPDYTRSFQETFARVAEAQGTHLVPFLLDGVAGEAALNQGDGIHPTARGHQVIAATVWKVLEPVLRSVHQRHHTEMHP